MSRPIRKINLFLFFVVAVNVGLLLLTAPASAEETTAFLYRPYYGPFPGWTSLVDHEYPTYYYAPNGNGLPGSENNIFTRYDGMRWTNPPTSTPVDVKHCTDGGGNRCYDGHDGIDYVLSYKPVVAAAPGTVEFSGWDMANDHTYGLGLTVRINHNNNHRTKYGHLSMVRFFAGASITGRWQIGTSGTTGNSSGPHLHFGVEYLQNGAWKVIDPYGWTGTYADPWIEKSGGVVSKWLFVSDPLQPPPTYNGDYYLDNDDATYPNNFVLGCNAGTGSGNCPYWTYVSSGFWGDLRYTLPNGTTPDYWAKWIQPPTLPSTGQYEIEVYVPNWDPYNRSHAARYEICHANGCQTVVVDQHDVDWYNGGYTSSPGEWISLGRYNFNAGGSGYIKVTDAAYVGGYTDPADATKKILVDAVRWRNTH